MSSAAVGEEKPAGPVGHVPVSPAQGTFPAPLGQLDRPGSRAGFMSTTSRGQDVLLPGRWSWGPWGQTPQAPPATVTGMSSSLSHTWLASVSLRFEICPGALCGHILPSPGHPQHGSGAERTVKLGDWCLPWMTVGTHTCTATGWLECGQALDRQSNGRAMHQCLSSMGSDAAAWGARVQGSQQQAP